MAGRKLNAERLLGVAQFANWRGGSRRKAVRVQSSRLGHLGGVGAGVVSRTADVSTPHELQSEMNLWKGWSEIGRESGDEPALALLVSKGCALPIVDDSSTSGNLWAGLVMAEKTCRRSQ
jgi:hypothetical protein